MKRYFIVSILKRGLWQDYEMCVGRKDLARTVMQAALKRGVSTIRVDECDKDGEQIQ